MFRVTQLDLLLSRNYGNDVVDFLQLLLAKELKAETNDEVILACLKWDR